MALALNSLRIGGVDTELAVEAEYALVHFLDLFQVLYLMLAATLLAHGLYLRLVQIEAYLIRTHLDWHSRHQIAILALFDRI